MCLRSYKNLKSKWVLSKYNVKSHTKVWYWILNGYSTWNNGREYGNVSQSLYIISQYIYGLKRGGFASWMVWERCGGSYARHYIAYVVSNNKNHSPIWSYDASTPLRLCNSSHILFNVRWGVVFDYALFSLEQAQNSDYCALFKCFASHYIGVCFTFWTILAHISLLATISVNP